MAITETDPKTGALLRTLHVGRVIKTQTYVATRNHSDTLDYSDFRPTKVTEFLVYRGRFGKPSDWDWVEPRALELTERFSWVDCTNMFTWRGEHVRSGEVDIDVFDPVFASDYADWQAHCAEQAKIQAEKAAARAAQDAQHLAERAKNTPVVGKRMEVCKGRKVPKGFVGVVSYISGSGSVLLKAENEWQDRKAQGTWVSAANLKAV